MQPDAHPELVVVWNGATDRAGGGLLSSTLLGTAGAYTGRQKKLELAGQPWPYEAPAPARQDGGTLRRGSN